jgi:hypothetical protein
MNYTDIITKRFPGHRDLTLSFVFEKKGKELRARIFQDSSGWTTELAHLDGAFVQQIPWRGENTFEDVIHEIGVYAACG